MEKIGDDCKCQQRGAVSDECIEGILGVDNKGVRSYPALPCSLDARNFMMPKKGKRSTEGFKVNACECGTNKLEWLEYCVVCLKKRAKNRKMLK